MPIRINLLAEQQIAEEQRLRNPVKLGIWVGGFLVALMLLWALSLYFNVKNTQAELNRYQIELKSMEDGQNHTKSNYFSSRAIEGTLASLQKYSSNRFLWGTVLDAVQSAVSEVNDIRLEKLESTQDYLTNPPTLFKTNLAFSIGKPGLWPFGGATSPPVDIPLAIGSQLRLITNQARFLTNTFERTIRITITTNRENDQATARIEIATPAYAIERTTLILSARDYSSPPGSQANAFTEAICRVPFFKNALDGNDGQGVRWKELAALPAEDPNDPAPATRKVPYLRFTLECRFKNKALSNE